MKTIRKHEEALIRAEVTYQLLKEQNRRLEIDIAELEEGIEELKKNIAFYRKEWKDQMLQDQGVSDGES